MLAGGEFEFEGLVEIGEEGNALADGLRRRGRCRGRAGFEAGEVAGGVLADEVDVGGAGWRRSFGRRGGFKVGVGVSDSGAGSYLMSVAAREDVVEGVEEAR